jgi:hypothetical protein
MGHNVVEVIQRLVAAHGETGLSPTVRDWTAIFEFDGRPIEIMNLLKFKAEVATPDGPISGAAAYGRYAAANAQPFARVGGERLYFGRVAHIFGLGEAPDWDAAILTRYPSPLALASMWLDPDFIAAHRNRADGVERSQVLVFGKPGAAELRQRLRVIPSYQK